LVLVVGLLTLRLVLFLVDLIAECFAEMITINSSVSTPRVPRTLFLEELLELLLGCRFPASLRMIDSHDSIVSLSFSGWTRVVLLAFVGAVRIVVVDTPREPLSHLLLLL
jgi:hypothetical protein